MTFDGCTLDCKGYQRDGEELAVLNAAYDVAYTDAERAVILALQHAIEENPSCSCAEDAEDFVLEQGIDRLEERQ